MVVLFVVLTFVAFLVIDFYVIKAQKKKHAAFSSQQVFDQGSFLLPEGFALSKNHLWLKMLKDGNVKIGIDEFVGKVFSAIRIHPIASEGSVVKSGDVLFELSSGSHKIHFASPVSGTVKSINKNLESQKVSDPYENDWGFIIEPTDFKVGMFKVGKQGLNWLKDEFNRFKDFLSIQIAEPNLAGVTYADGGNIVEGVLSNLEEKSVKEFQNQFISL